LPSSRFPAIPARRETFPSLEKEKAIGTWAGAKMVTTGYELESVAKTKADYHRKFLRDHPIARDGLLAKIRFDNVAGRQ
jgi:hypothetical protein